MLAFIFKRLLQSVVVMLTVALIAFALFRYVGDPINNMVGQDTTLEERAELKERLGLNDPFIIQFYHCFFFSNFCHFCQFSVKYIYLINSCQFSL